MASQGNGGQEMNDVVLKPRMSEKTYAQSANGVFVFVVDHSLNKHQIADAVEKTYEVNVVDVRIVIHKGKEKRSYRNKRYENGVRSDIKKAYVTLAKGQSIPIFAAVEEPEEEKPLKNEKRNKKNGGDKK